MKTKWNKSTPPDYYLKEVDSILPFFSEEGKSNKLTPPDYVHEENGEYFAILLRGREVRGVRICDHRGYSLTNQSDISCAGATGCVL